MPNTSAVTGVASPGTSYQATNAWIPACTMSPIQERSSADSRRNQGMSRSIRVMVEVVSDPTDCWRRRAIASRPASALPGVGMPMPGR